MASFNPWVPLELQAPLVGAANQDPVEATDARIVMTDNYIRDLKRSRNARVPIGRFSPETLLEIFFCLRDCWRTPVGAWSAPLMGWVAVTHVSHHWRTISLASPGLWTVIDIGRGTPLL
ncbi:hypothetical protein B0H21DRAFT_699443, partial [Amylocystis lapponica]